MQEETQLVYDKYGTSPVGGCGSILIQFPILLGLWKVIQNIPAYVGGIKAAYEPLATQIMATDGYQKIMEGIGKPLLIDPRKFDYANQNTIIDILYKLTDQTWGTLSDKFPQLESVIASTQADVKHFNTFLGINIAETPQTMFMEGIRNGAFMIAIIALLIPVLSGLTQWLSVKLAPQPQQDGDNPMAAQMKTMNIVMPLMSVFMCFSFQAGLGIYWIASAVVRCFQQILVNKHLSKMSIDELVEKNKEKAKKKREKRAVSAQNLNQMAQRNVKNIEEPKMTEQEKEAKLKSAAEANRYAKEGSLAAKANMVKKFNENN